MTDAPKLVSFRSLGDALRGFLHKPAGPGPFPAMTWNHGSEKHPDEGHALGDFYASIGYVLFLPHRRGHGQSPGDHFAEEVKARARERGGDPASHRREIIRLVIESHEAQVSDTVAAVSWLRRQPFVDGERMAMSGVSFGAIQTILAAEADAGVSAYVPFAPAAMAWDTNPEIRERLLRALGNTSAPMFLLQAENDYSLGPSEVLGAALKSKGSPNRARVYPPYGDTRQAGHGDFACRGADVWGDDVAAFLQDVREQRRPTAGSSPLDHECLLGGHLD